MAHSTSGGKLPGRRRKLRLTAAGLAAGAAIAVPALVLAVYFAHGHGRPAAVPGSAVPPVRIYRAPTPAATAKLPAGFPSQSDTGVPPGTPLQKVPGQISSGPGWYYDRRGWVEVRGRGAVLSGLYIPCNLNVAASDVTISHDWVVNGGRSAIVISLRHARNVTIEDSTVSGRDAGRGRAMAGIKDVYADSTGTTLLRDDISMAATGVQLESGLVKDSYIHDPGFMAGDHVNGIMSNGGSLRPLTIDHNTILIDRGQTDAIGLFEDFGIQANRVITRNLLAGGGYAIYAGQNRGGPPTRNIVITDNQVSNAYYANGGYYGYLTDFNRRGRDNIFSGNTWNASKAALAVP
jgi:hypothetical protein